MTLFVCVVNKLRLRDCFRLAYSRYRASGTSPAPCRRDVSLQASLFLFLGIRRSNVTLKKLRVRELCSRAGFGAAALRAQHILAATVVLLATPTFAQVTPSGQTATSVTAAGGHQTITIAPTVSGGLSYNSYTAFSVGTAGASFDNRTVGARTIANEVISSQRSLIQGPIDVLGSRAHVILANPNGITIDGGSFINTGGVVLGTGSLQLVTVTPAPHITQTNVLLHTNGTGDILVGPGGLSGTMTSLQLYAGSIKVNGAVTYTQEDPNAPKVGTISLLAGKSDVTLDSAVLPIASLDNWATVTNKGTGSSAILVDVTALGSLSASRVYIGVSEKGAGVSYAGKGLASAGDFNLTSTGQVTFTGAQITSAGNTKVTANAITVLNSPAQQSQLVAVQGALTLLATNGDLNNLGGLLQGATRNATDTDSKGGVTLKASGNITQVTTDPTRLAVSFASADDLSVTAGGSINNTSGRFLSNQQANITAGGTFYNGLTLTGVPSNAGQLTQTSSSSRGHWYQFWRSIRRSGLAVSYGNLSVPGQLGYVSGAGVTITAANVINSGGEIDANSGNVKITTGNLTNAGVVSGTAQFNQRCQFWCTVTGSSNLAVNGGAINASGTITVAATGAVTNTAGQWLGIDGVSITGARVALTGVTLVNVTLRPSGLRSLFTGYTGWTTLTDAGGAILSTNGGVTITSPTAVQVDRGYISAAGTVVTPGGVTTLMAPTTVSPVGTHQIGVLWGPTRDLFNIPRNGSP